MIFKNNAPFINCITKINGIKIDNAEDLNSKSFDYKANFIGSVTNNNLIKNDVKIVIPLKHLSNFWKNLNIPLINCEVELILTWFKNLC